MNTTQVETRKKCNGGHVSFWVTADAGGKDGGKINKWQQMNESKLNFTMTRGCAIICLSVENKKVAEFFSPKRVATNEF